MRKPTFAVLLLILCSGHESLRAADATLAASPPKLSAGLVNDLLRQESPEAAAWDIGGEFRVRFEAKQNSGSFPNRDFTGDLDNSNDYFLFRTKAHLGWSPASWFNAGRQVLPRDGHFNVVNDYDWFSGLYASTRRLAPWQDTEFYLQASLRL